MHTTEGPAPTGKHLLLDPDATGPSPADHGGAPVEPPSVDRTTPDVSTATAEPMAAPATDKAQMLTRLVAEGRQPRARRIAELEPYRDVLLAERRANASIRLLAQSLARLGVTISEETLRVWLLRQKMPKRRRPRKKPAAAVKPNLGAGTMPRYSPIANLGPSPKPEPHRRNPRIARDDF